MKFQYEHNSDGAHSHVSIYNPQNEIVTTSGVSSQQTIHCIRAVRRILHSADRIKKIQSALGYLYSDIQLAYAKNIVDVISISRMFSCNAAEAEALYFLAYPEFEEPFKNIRYST